MSQANGLLVLVFVLLNVACQPPPPGPSPHQSESATSARESTGDKIEIFVTSNGWHTGIVIARSALPEDAIPETADFGEVRYLSFGWGDAEYYPAPKPTFAMALRAGMVPTDAVVHLAGLMSAPAKAFPGDEIVTMRLSERGFANLVRYLDAAFQRTGGKRSEAVGPGLYRLSRFYPAVGKFHLFNTCNTWTARGLEAAGVAVNPGQSQSAEDLMAQLRGG